MKNEDKELIEQYEKMMRGAPRDREHLEWVKEGNMYKVFSIYDSSKYESVALNQINK